MGGTATGADARYNRRRREPVAQTDYDDGEDYDEAEDEKNGQMKT